MADNGTLGRIHTFTCPRPAPEYKHELRPWDGVHRDSPAQEYLKKARGGLDPVRGDSLHYQQSANTQDALIGEALGGGLGYALKLGGKLAGAAKGVVKPVVSPKPPTIAARAGNGVVIVKSGRKISPEEHRAWLEKNGYRDPDGHVRAANPEQPIEIVRLEPGDKIDMWVRDGGIPGSYGTAPGTNPGTLGIETTGRHLETITVTKPIEVIRSTVADFPSGQIPGVGGNGGGIQYQLPRGYSTSVSGR